jgi:uncharacterized protein involved in exopolysaccharide biosynthesis
MPERRVDTGSAVAPPRAADAEERSVWWYLALAVRRRRLIVTIPPLVVAISVTLALVQPRQYRASGSFLPQESSTPPSGLTQIALQFGLRSVGRATSSPEFYAELLQSREILRNVVTTVYDIGGPKPFHGNLVEFYRVLVGDSTTAVMQAVEQLRAAMTVRTDRNVGITTFEVRMANPGLAERVASRLLELVNAFNLDQRQAQARAEREFVQERLAGAKAELSVAEDALVEFSARNVQFTAPGLRAEEARLQRRVSLQQQLYINLAQTLEMAQLEELRSTPVITIVEPPDGFVEPLGRGLKVRALTALLVGFLVAYGMALAAESLARGGGRGVAEYQELIDLLRRVRAGLRGRGEPPREG